MKVTSRTLYQEIGNKDTRRIYFTNHRFLAHLRSCPADRMRVVVRYADDKATLLNDSGWYSGKTNLLKTAKAFLET